MPIHFICPNCGAATNAADQFAGQTGPCASCGKAITIPFPNGVARLGPRGGAKTMLGILAIVLVVAAGTVAVSIALIVPTLWAGREAARRALCADNLSQIAQAMLQYEAVNGCFPPAYLVDRHGKPMHSWRALLLPYLEQQELADRYRFDEPWDSPNNRTITDLTLGVYQCPSQPVAVGPTTNYMMVVGPHTISNGRHGRTIAEITDGPTDTIVLVEVADSTTRWAQPEDLRFDKLHFTINGRKQQTPREISSHHARGANVAFGDGSVRFLKDSTNPQLVKAMLTIDGTEPIERREPQAAAPE